MTLDPSKLLASLPSGLREPLLKTYFEISSNFAEYRWEPSELNGGKFSEVVFSIVSGALKGSFPPVPQKPKNMKDACLSLEQAATTLKAGDRSLRILLPRALLTLYEVRNNRGVGHVGGDVNPNLMDATLVYSMSSWIMAELVRIFHNLSTADAQQVVDALSERKLPLVWCPGGPLKRVLDVELSKSDQTLLLLHQNVNWVDEDDLFRSVEYGSARDYRTRILAKLHKSRFIEFDRGEKRARISPKGSEHVQRSIVAPRATALP